MSYDPSAIRSGAIFSDSPNYLAGWLCYINGIEVPIMGFTVEESVWEIPKFQIHMVPDPAIQRLGYEDRVFVSLFYLDNHMDVLHKEYRLLIDGEIVGYSYQAVAGQRVISYTCLAHINVFKSLYFFFMNTVDDIVAGQDPMVQSQGITQTGLFYPYSLFHQGLIAPANTGQAIGADGTPLNGRVFQNPEERFRQSTTSTGTDDPNNPQDDVIKAPFELVYNVIRGIIADTVPAERRSVPAMNFFARHVRKTRLHQRFVRLPILEDPAVLNNHLGVFPIFNAARNSEALAAMQRQSAGQVSNSGSVWDMLQQVLQLVYMEIAMIPAAPCIQANLDGEILGPASEAAVSRQTQQVTAPTVGLPEANANTSLVNALAGPITADTVAGMLVEHLRSEHALAEESSPLGNNLPTEDQIHDAVAAAALTPNITPEQLINTAAQWTRAWDGSRRGLPRIPANVLSGIGPALQTRLQGLRQLEQVQRTIQQQREQQQRDEQQRQQQIANANQENNAPTGVNPAQPLRLAQYFVKPQFLFGIPPHCNVIFPSMIDNYSYTEDYLAQPTRLYVNDSVMTQALRAQGAQREFMLHALTTAYPEEAEAVLHQALGGSDDASGGSLVTQGTAGSTAAHTPTARDMNGRSLLIWPEEFYKGPVVSRMSLPRWFQFLQQMRQSSGTAPAPSTQTGTQGTGATAGNAPAAGGATQNTTTGQTNPAAAAAGALGAGVPGATPTGAGVAPQSASTPTPGGPTLTAVNAAAVRALRTHDIPYGGAMPAAWAREHHPEGVRRWRDPVIRRMFEQSVTRMLPGANPFLLLGISLNGAFNENTTGFRTGLPDERAPGNPLIAINRNGQPIPASATITFHEMGPFGVEGGSRANPVPNAQGNNWWIRLSNHPDVVAVLGHAAPTNPGGWIGHPSQWVVGIKNQAERVRLMREALGNLGPRGSSTTWAIALSAWAWSSGITRAAAHIRQIHTLYPQLASVPEESRWTALLRFLADAYVQHRITNTPRSSHANLYYSAVRTQQKMRGGYAVAQAVGGSIAGMDVLMGTDDAAINFLIVQGAYNNHLATPVRGGVLGNSSFLQSQSFEVNVAPRVARGPQRVTAALLARTSAVVTPERHEVTRETTTSPTQATVDGNQATTGAVPNAPPTPGGAPTVTVAQPPIEENSDASFQQLFRLYAQYEYLRQRYAARNSGVLLRFNPYVVVGFPCFVFDSMRTQQHITAYVMSKTHSAFVNPGGQGTFDTQLGLSCVRTLPEFIQDVRNDCERFTDRLVAAPAEIIEEIRTVIQNETQADLLYRRLFYQNRPRPGNRKSAFVFTDALGYQNNLTAESIDISVRTETVPDTAAINANVATVNAATNPITANTVADMVVEYLRTEHALADRSSPLGNNLPTEEQIRGAVAGAAQTPNITPEQLANTAAQWTRAWDGSNRGLPRIPANVLSGLAPTLQGRLQGLRQLEQVQRAIQQQPANADQNGTGTPTGPTTTRRTLVNTLDPNQPLIPLPETEYAGAFDNFHLAMQMVSRPICTLTEYIRFLHAGATLQSLIAAGIVEPGTDDMGYGVVFEPVEITTNTLIRRQGLAPTGAPIQRNTAVAYARIFKLRAGPGNRPSAQERGYEVGGTITAASPPTGVNSGYPQTRVDWDEVLRSYRTRIRSRVAPGL